MPRSLPATKSGARKAAAGARGRHSWTWVVPAGLGGITILAALWPRRSATTTARGITPAIYTLAEKWARARGLPLSWVLATILVESGGNANLQGDCFDKTGARLPECKSLGLMQVNWAAHNARLVRDGLATRRQDLFDPETNVRAGTLLLKEAYDTVHAALGSQPSPIPMDLLVRFAYKGPALVANALRAGQDPRPRFSDAGRTETRWAQALSQIA